MLIASPFPKPSRVDSPHAEAQSAAAADLDRLVVTDCPEEAARSVAETALDRFGLRYAPRPSRDSISASADALSSERRPTERSANACPRFAGSSTPRISLRLLARPSRRPSTSPGATARSCWSCTCSRGAGVKLKRLPELSPFSDLSTAGLNARYQRPIF